MAASLSYVACHSMISGSVHDPDKKKLSNIKISGKSSMSMTKKAGLLRHVVAVATTSVAENGSITLDQIRQNIPTEKQFVDEYRQGLIVEEGVGYRQTVVIRSYEVGPDKTATLESILNLLQETALNHVWMSGLLGDGFGATHGMMRNNLIWVVSRMQVQVDHYPVWGEVIEIDTWVGASGKNGMKRDWQLRSHTTGRVFARATSTWVMMNQQTRRLSKMPDEVRAEISPWFIKKQAIEEDSPEKIAKLDNNAKYENLNLRPKRSDLDMNLHVNNVKYVQWMLEAIPDQFLENHQLSNIILEYRRECGSSDIVQSLCEPQDNGILKEGLQEKNVGLCNIGSGSLNEWPSSYTHILQTKGEKKIDEIVRGKTTWKKKTSTVPFSMPVN
ncbi:hypothetical protein LguiA_000622 [Lonicera macranthoides]